MLKTMTTAMIAGIAAVLLSACGGRGGIMGEKEAFVDAPVEETHEAFVATLREQGLQIEKNAQDASTGMLVGEYADGKEVTIHTTRVTDDTSKVTIQVGKFGDEERSERLLDLARQRIEG